MRDPLSARDYYIKIRSGFRYPKEAARAARFGRLSHYAPSPSKSVCSSCEGLRSYTLYYSREALTVPLHTIAALPKRLPFHKGELRVLTKSRKNEALIRNDGMYVISGIFSRANACKKVKARRAEVASTRSAQARNTAQAKRRGARRPPPVAETGRSKPNEAGRATSELASAVERPC